MRMHFLEVNFLDGEENFWSNFTNSRPLPWYGFTMCIFGMILELFDALSFNL